MIENPITIQEAKFLMEILQNDIPSSEKSRIALILLILSANSSLAEDGKEIITKNKWENHNNIYRAIHDTERDDYYAEYYGY